MNRCQVCGIVIKEGQDNCPLHQYVQKKSLALVKYIWNIELGIYKPPKGSSYGEVHLMSTRVKELAKEFDVSVTTVYRHLKQAGFSPQRSWKKTDELS